jgi:hypothetical protein
MPEYTLLTWLLVLGLWLTGKPSLISLRRCAGLIALITCLVAAQLLPFAELLIHSQRHKMFEPSMWSLPLSGWANFFVPLFHTRPVPQGAYFSTGQYLFTSFYVTLPAVIMAIYAVIFTRDPKVRFLTAAAALGFWLALGKNGYLHTWLLDICPALSFMRYPVKFLALILIALPCLAGFGLAHWANPHAARLPKQQRTFLALAIAAAAIIVAIIGYAERFPLPDHHGPWVWRNGLVRITFLVISTGLLLALRRHFAQPKVPMQIAAALLLVMVADSFTQVPRFSPTVKPSAYDKGVLSAHVHTPLPPGTARAFMTRTTHDFLYFNMLPDTYNDLVGRRVNLFGNLNLIDNVATADGFYAMYLPKARQLWEQLFTAPPEHFPAPLADFLGITYMTGLNDVFQTHTRTQAMPIVTAGQQPRFRPDKTALAGLIHPRFDPRTMVYLPLEATNLITFTNATRATVLKQQFGPHHITAEVEAAEPSVVVFAQAHYPAWKAFVDGVPTPIVPANYAFKAIQIPAGTHSVELRYVDRAFQLGAIISSITLLGSLVSFSLAWRARHTAPARYETQRPQPARERIDAAGAMA